MKKNKNVNEVSPLFITQEQYDKLREKLEKLKRERYSLSKDAKAANATMSSDKRHSRSRDAFLNDLAIIDAQIIGIIEDLNRAQIIEKTNHYRRVNIGDTVKVKCTFLGEEPEEMILKLVTYVDGCKDRYFENGMAISVSSSMGSAIHNKLIGENISYSEGKIEILEKMLSPELINVGDVVNIIYEQEGYYKEPLTVMLVEELPKEKIDGIQYVSINAPMGKSIYAKQVGDIFSYQSNHENHSVQILEKLSLEKMKPDYRKLSKD